jgi:hypothetical protein
MAPSLRHYDDRQGRELHNYDKYNEGDTGLFIEQSRYHAASQPSHTISNVKEPECKVASSFSVLLT